MDSGNDTRSAAMETRIGFNGDFDYTSTQRPGSFAAFWYASNYGSVELSANSSFVPFNPYDFAFPTSVLKDYWDSITNNNYFSSEGLMDVIKQLWIYKTPELESPKYQILKRTANYEVRKYSPFVVVETDGDKLSGATGFHAVAGLPEPNKEKIKLRKLEGGIAVVSKFSGKPTEDVVREKEKSLQSSLIKDSLRPATGCLLARYNDPGRTLSFIMRNEVLIWLEEFALE